MTPEDRAAIASYDAPPDEPYPFLPRLVPCPACGSQNVSCVGSFLELYQCECGHEWEAD